MQQPADNAKCHELRAKLTSANGVLLEIHKALLDHKREGYKRQPGRIEPSG